MRGLLQRGFLFVDARAACACSMPACLIVLVTLTRVKQNPADLQSPCPCLMHWAPGAMTVLAATAWMAARATALVIVAGQWHSAGAWVELHGSHRHAAGSRHTASLHHCLVDVRVWRAYEVVKALHEAVPHAERSDMAGGLRLSLQTGTRKAVFFEGNSGVCLPGWGARASAVPASGHHAHTGALPGHRNT